MVEVCCTTAEDFLPAAEVPHARLVADADLRRILSDLKEAQESLQQAELAALSALSRTGIPTPAEGFVKAGWGWLQSAILELGYRSAKCARCVRSEPKDAPIHFAPTEPTDPSDLELTSDQANALEEAYAVARQARATFGCEVQDNKVIEECSELSRAIAQRHTCYRIGGKRGDVDEEAADVLLTVLGMAPPDSDVWVNLRAKTARLKRLLEQKEAGRG